ncbi:MAG: hypothetical protein ABL956_17285 [Hyphomonadaceae bacterium]
MARAFTLLLRRAAAAAAQIEAEHDDSESFDGSRIIELPKRS